MLVLDKYEIEKQSKENDSSFEINDLINYMLDTIDALDFISDYLNEISYNHYMIKFISNNSVIDYLFDYILS